jgi:type II secretory pathway predicted ATPase ExeA
MYERYWGLERQPFTRDLDAETLEASAAHREALARLDFLRASQLPLGLLVGPPGSGKSSVLAEFARRAERAGALAVTIAATAADESLLLSELVIGLGAQSSEETWQRWSALEQRLAELSLDGLRSTVLIDDLDRATTKGQAVVERLLSLSAASLTLVASARAETVNLISREIADQAALRIELVPWTATETSEYLSRSLQSSARKEPVFSTAAAKQLFALSGGAPRKVRQLAQLSLVAGASQELPHIDEQTVWAVHEELSVAR